MSKVEDVYGIGTALAAKLAKKGYTTRASLKTIMATLPKSAQIDLTFNPIKKIPRATITELEKLFKKNIAMKHVVAGSYRRLLPTSRDIDVVILYNGADLFADLKDKLALHSVIAKGPRKLSCLIKYKGKNYKIDFFICNKREWIYTLFYATGSASFNIWMRKEAKRGGMLLNQYGLYKNAKLIPCETEKQIMDILEIEYRTPDLRY